jgi:hypothetical protein
MSTKKKKLINEEISKKGNDVTQAKNEGVKKSTTENTVEKNDTEKTVEEQAQALADEITDAVQGLAQSNPPEEKPKKVKELKLSANGKAIVFTKELRIEIDKAMQLASLSDMNKVELNNSLFNAKSWLGKCLAQLGTVNPYITKDPIESAKQIPPTVDVYNDPKFIYNFKNNTKLQKVLFLRDQIATAVEMLESINLTKVKFEDGRLLSIAISQCYIHLSEARFELGAELGRIRNANS